MRPPPASLLLPFLAFAACPHPAPPAPPPPAAASIHAEAVQLLQEYLRIDTTNPPGHEMRAALFVKAVLDREGIANELIDLGGDRANLYAVLRGDGSKRAVVLNHHMDVVPAEARHWRVPPFSGRIVGGEIYGRGAIDIKGKGIIDLMTLVRLKRLGRRLSRDVVFLAVSDEEGGSIGALHMVQRRPELLRGAELLLDEGQSIRIDREGRLLGYMVAVGEKAPLWLTITFRGRAGHGSVPIADSAASRAVRAAQRILAYETPLRVLPEVRRWLRLQLRGRDLTRLPGWRGDLERSLDAPDFLRELAKDEQLNPALRDTISLTGLRGSDKINTISNEAALQLDCRLLPGSDKDAFLAGLRRAIDDATAQIKIEEHFPPSRSPLGSELLHALERCATRRDPGAEVVPTILFSSTDAAYFRRLGIHAYGFEPYRIREDQDLSHGNDERISVANVRFGIDLLTELLQELGRR